MGRRARLGVAMKLVTFATDAVRRDPRPGLLHQGRVIDLVAHWPVETLPVPETLTVLLGYGPLALDALRAALDAGRFIGPGPALEEVSLLAPVLEPPSLRDFYAFEAHVATAMGKRGMPVPPAWYDAPVFYFSNTSGIYGPAADVPYPASSRALDYELEIACVIGRAGRDIPAGEAEAYIAGYTIVNDWSARDVQLHEMSVFLGPAKGKDFATSLGPWLVTPDELADRATGDGRYDLTMTARVNGREYSRGNLRDIHWTFGQMIERASRHVELRPGDVFGSGTVGSGCILELGPEEWGWLRPGDTVELAIERLGVLRNRVV